MTASVLKQDPMTQKVQTNAIYQDKTQQANFQIFELRIYLFLDTRVSETGHRSATLAD